MDSIYLEAHSLKDIKCYSCFFKLLETFMVGIIPSNYKCEHGKKSLVKYYRPIENTFFFVLLVTINTFIVLFYIHKMSNGNQEVLYLIYRNVGIGTLIIQFMFFFSIKTRDIAAKSFTYFLRDVKFFGVTQFLNKNQFKLIRRVIRETALRIIIFVFLYSTYFISL